MENVLLPPVKYGRHTHSPSDASLKDLPFGSSVSRELISWLGKLPSDTRKTEAYVAAQWREMSWSAFNVYVSDLITDAESEIGMSGHSYRVSHLALRCGVALGLQPLALSELYWGGALHDLGKLAMDQSILSKPSALSSYEWQLVRQHPVWGYEALMRVLNNRVVAEIALTHHEHWNGAGYPSGLSGEAIPLHGRIVAVVDTFDALTSPRAYKQAVRVDMALKILEDEAGRQFDPALIRRFLDGDTLQLRDPGTDYPDVG